MTSPVQVSSAINSNRTHVWISVHKTSQETGTSSLFFFSLSTFKCSPNVQEEASSMNSTGDKDDHGTQGKKLAVDERVLVAQALNAVVHVGLAVQKT